jgi:nucleoid-associated protein YgaU
MILSVIITSFIITSGVSGTETFETKEIAIRTGDTLWDIAEFYKPSDRSFRSYLDEIYKINNVDPEKLLPEQIIKIPLYGSQE